MTNMIGICGLNCSDCPIFKATQNNDDNVRRKLAKKWASKESPLEPKDINCQGCLTDRKPKFKYIHLCEVRMCGLKNKVENCAHCSEYTCPELDQHLKQSGFAKAKAKLEAIRKNL